MTTLKTSEEDVKTTLKTSGEDVRINVLGRPLLAGPTYEQVVTNLVNPQSSPEVNFTLVSSVVFNLLHSFRV